MQGIIVGRAWAHNVISMHLSTSDMEWHAYFWAVMNMCDEMESVIEHELIKGCCLYS